MQRWLYDFEFFVIFLHLFYSLCVLFVLGGLVFDAANAGWYNLSMPLCLRPWIVLLVLFLTEFDLVRLADNFIFFSHPFEHL